MRSTFIFTSWPYVALGIFAVILGLRFLFALRKIDEMRTRVSKAWEVFGGGALWKLSVILLLAGHFLGVFFSGAILWWNSKGLAFLYLLEGFGFLLGLIALFGWARLAWKHLDDNSSSPVKQMADTVLIALLLVGIVTGLLMAAKYRWASSWGVATLTPYILTVLRGRPISIFAGEMPFLVQLHVFSFFVALAVLPFTRLAPVLIVALHRILGFAGKPLLAGAEAMEGWISRHNPAAWIWPEED